MRPHSRRVLLLLAASALAARALLVPAVPRASPLALRTLRDIAVVGARLGEMQQAVRQRPDVVVFEVHPLQRAQTTERLREHCELVAVGVEAL